MKEEEKKIPVYSVQNTSEGNERRRPRHALYRETEKKNTGRGRIKKGEGEKEKEKEKKKRN